MPYRFGQDEPIADAGRRVVVEQLRKASADLRGDEAIGSALHASRKHLKKARAVLALLRSGMAKSEARKERRHFRDAARELACVRDARVRVDTLDQLRAWADSMIEVAAFERVRRELRADVVRAQRTFRRADGRERVATTLDRAAERLAGLRIDDRDGATVSEGLKRCYAAGRKAWRGALKKPTDQGFHNWRKCVKELAYAEQLLRGIWPGVMRARARSSHRLGELLGRDHDLAMLRDTLAEQRERFGEEGDVAALVELARQRSRALRAEAVHLAERVYAESPSAYGERMGTYLERWRELEPKDGAAAGRQRAVTPA